MKMRASPPLLGDMPSPGLSEGRVAFWEMGAMGVGEGRQQPRSVTGPDPPCCPSQGREGSGKAPRGAGSGAPSQQCVDLGSLGEDSRNGSCPNKNRLLRRVWG